MGEMVLLNGAVPGCWEWCEDFAPVRCSSGDYETGFDQELRCSRERRCKRLISEWERWKAGRDE